MINALMVGVGGFFGCMLRYGFTRILMSPLATLVSNVLAGIIVGILYGLEKEQLLTDRHRLLLVTGMMGGLSTFSTFSLETIRYFEEQRMFMAVGNILINVSLSLAGVLIGMLLSTLIKNRIGQV